VNRVAQMSHHIEPCGSLCQVTSPAKDREPNGDPTPSGNARGQQRRRELLRTAVDYLLSEGLQDFSVRQIAKRADTSHRIVLYHFESTEKLLREALGAIREPILQRLKAADPGTFAAEILREDSPAAEVLTQSVLQAGLDPDRYGDIGRDYVDAYLPLITDNLPAAIDSATRADIAALVLCAYRGANLDRRSTGEAERGERALALLVRLLEDEFGQPAPTANRRRHQARSGA
jgi:AcrR family transcriptional regulator